MHQLHPHRPGQPGVRARRAVTALVASASLMLGACAITLDNAPRNRPLSPSAPPLAADQPSTDVGVALSFSGGGARAAAFALGALRGLEALPGPDGHSLLSRVGFVTSVSGGSLTAAWIGLHGTDSLDRFHSTVLMKNSEERLRASLLNPMNLMRLAAGGVNDRGNYLHWLDNDVFQGATFSRMSRDGRPAVWINATNLQHRVAFTFHEQAFEALCSDLASYPVAEAVAASMAVPLIFAPVVLEKFPTHCRVDMTPVLEAAAASSGGPSMSASANLAAARDLRDLRTGRYIKLVDGGLTDNFGLSSILQARFFMGTPYAPFSETQALNIRRMLFVVVDGGRQPAVEWNHVVNGPDGIEMAMASVDVAIDTNVRMSFDAFTPMVQQWRNSVVRWRCAQPPDVQQRQREARADWRCDDLEFSITRISFRDLEPQREAMLNDVSTRLMLPPGQVELVTNAGRDAILANPVVRRFSVAAKGERPE
jgi:NTE family protein